MFLGFYTNCCQHIGNLEGPCYHGQASPYAAFMVVEYKDRIVAQAWTWEGEDGRICFDNIEAAQGFCFNSTIKSLVETLASKLERTIVVGSRYTDIAIEDYPVVSPAFPKDFFERIPSEEETHVNESEVRLRLIAEWGSDAQEQRLVTART